MGTTLVRHTGLDSDGKPQLKQLSSTDENYVAYQAGLNLSSNTSIASLTGSSSSSLIIGNYTDTKYNQAVGTHGTTLTTTTTSSDLYQKTGTASETGSSKRKPVEYQKVGSNTTLQEMSTSEVDTLTDRLVSRIFTSDYPGTYKLGTTAPSGDYSAHLSNVFDDTRVDGTSINYSIYVRDTMTAPSVKRPLYIKRSSGLTGTYQGLQEMSDAQMQYTFGQRAKTRIMRNEGGGSVGTYVLLSSSLGNPTQQGYGGTWAAKGVATDTKQQVADTAYTRLSTRNRNSNYTRLSTGNYSRDFAGNYTRVTSTTDYSRTSTRNFAGNYLGNYSRSYSRDFTGANYTRTSNRDYTRTSNRDFARISTGTSSYTGNYTGDYSRNFSRIRSSNYARNYAGNFSTNYARTFVGNYVENSTVTYTGATPTFTRNYTGNYIGTSQGPTTVTNFSHNFATPMTTWSGPTNAGVSVIIGGTTVASGPSGGTTITTSNGSTVTVYTRGTLAFSYSTARNYNFSRTVYTTIYNTDYTRTVSGFTGNYTRNSVGAASPLGAWGAYFYQANSTVWNQSIDVADSTKYNNSIKWTGTSVVEFTQTSTSTNPQILNGGTYQYQRGTVQGNNGDKLFPTYYYSVRRRNIQTSYQGNYARTRNSTYVRTAGWTRITLYAEIINRTSNYARITSTRTSNRNFARNITDNYARAYTRIGIVASTGAKNYEGNYSRDYLGNYSRDFTGDYVATRTSAYARPFTRLSTRDRGSNYLGNYTREFTTDYTRDRSSTYVGNYLGNYARTFAGNYTGNYTSEEVQSSNEVIETYTLYVRTG